METRFTDKLFIPEDRRWRWKKFAARNQVNLGHWAANTLDTVIEPLPKTREEFIALRESIGTRKEVCSRLEIPEETLAEMENEPEPLKIDSLSLIALKARIHD